MVDGVTNAENWFICGARMICDGGISLSLFPILSSFIFYMFYFDVTIKHALSLKHGGGKDAHISMP